MGNVTDVEVVVQNALCTVSDKTQNALFSGQCESQMAVDMTNTASRAAGDGDSALVSVGSGFDPSDNAVPADIVKPFAEAGTELVSSSGVGHKEELLEKYAQEMSPVSRTEQPEEEILETGSGGKTHVSEMCSTLSACGSVGEAKKSPSFDEEGHVGVEAKDSTPVCLDGEERTCQSVTNQRGDHSDISANQETASHSQLHLDSVKNQKDLSNMSPGFQENADFSEGLLSNDTKSNREQMADSEMAPATSRPSDSGDGFQTDAPPTSQENENEEDEEDSWDKIFDDNGDCLDPSMMAEVKLRMLNMFLLS